MLAAGTAIGGFEIRSLLGAGGMGEVYRAHDSRLGRDVALKILPAALAGDPDRLARFEREARALAALNHPHIATIHGVEDAGAVRALVLELVEGPTLADRIAEGPLAVPDALAIARQIADALAAAHGGGLVHRDLKPANVKVRGDGTVKVLDFGLAKHRALAAAVEPSGPAAATLTAMTHPGAVLGTPAYMSPEQARGHDVDARADIWAFGCVLYEMLTGRRPFAGATISDTLARVLEREPEWQTLPPAVPPGIRRLLRRCLAKDVHRRLHDIADARLELDDVLDPAAAALDERPTAPGGIGAGRRYALAACAAVVGAVLALLSVWAVDDRRPPEAPTVVTMTIPPPRGTSFPRGNGAPWPSMSPDGRHLAFVAIARGGEQRLWLRRLDTATARPLDGTSGAMRPFWSPDSRSIGFFANGRLARLDLDSGAVRALADAPYLGGLAGTWGERAIVWKAVGGLNSVPATGGAVTTILANPEEYNPVAPAFLPDGRRFVYTQLSTTDPSGRVCVRLAAAGADERCVLDAAVPVRYAAPGFLLLVRNAALMAQPFDLGTLAATGDASLVAPERFDVRSNFAPPPFSASADGVLAYHAANASTRLTWLDRSGAPLGSPLGEGIDPTLSRDGTRLAMSRRDERTGELDLWVVDLAQNREQRLTFSGRSSQNAAFSPDGTEVVFATGRTDALQLVVKRTDGTGAEESLGVRGSSPDWSPDGRHVLYQLGDAALNFDLWVVPRHGDRTPIAVAATAHGERQGRFSPDGRWIAYDSTESGRREIWLQPFPPNGSKWQVSTTGGTSVAWRRDGRELFYIAADGAMMAVPVDARTAPTWGTPRALFTTMFAGGNYGEFAAAPDGQRFLVPIPPGIEDETPITVVVNWIAALAR
jgi:Tol biopolymer transport system component